ncbi:MAG TPA: AAA family ATPase [Pirellulales bacterium]|nr:AAA family ATPase [Pirellulales bacterium]
MQVSLIENVGALHGIRDAAGMAQLERDGGLTDERATIGEIAAAPRPAGLLCDGPPARANLSPLALGEDIAEGTEWLWPSRVATRGLTIACASRQAGATAVALEVASRVSTGMPFPDQPSGAPWRPAGQVLFVADGPTRKRLAPRLAAVEASLDRCLAIPLVQDADHRLELAEVEEALARLRGCRLVVFDALRVGLWRDGELDDVSTRLFESLEGLAERFGVAVLAVVRLPGVANPSNRALGALASCVAALCSFVVLRDDTLPEHRSLDPLRCVGDTAALVFRFRRGPAGAAPGVEWRVEPGEGADCGGLALGLAAKERRSAAEWLRDELRNGPRTLSDLKTAARGDGYSWATVERAKRRSRVRSITVANGETRWALGQEAWSGTMRAPSPGGAKHEFAGVAVPQFTVQQVTVQQVRSLGWKTALLGEIRSLDQYQPLEGGQGGQNVNSPREVDPDNPSPSAIETEPSEFSHE